MTGVTVRLVSADPGWLDDGERRCAAAGAAVLGRHAPDETLPPSALVIVDAASVARVAPGGPCLVVGPAPAGLPIPVGDGGFLSHLEAWPSSSVGLAAYLRSQALDGAARATASHERLLDLGLRRLAEVETASIEVVDRDVRLVWVNRAFSEVTGFTLPSVIGRTTGELFRAGTHDPAFYREIMARLRGGRVWSGSMIGQRADGSLSFQDAVLAPVREGDDVLGFVALKRDFDRDAATERALHSTEDRARTMLQASSDAWIVHDREGRVLDQNATAARLLAGVGRAGKNLEELVEPADWPGVSAVWRGLVEGNPSALTCRLRTVDEDFRHVSVRSGLVSLAGESLVLSVVRDETERLHLQQTLREALHAAEAAAEARAAFLANMSHEIRTPMNAILGLADLALSHDLPPVARDYLTKLHGSAASLLGLIDDILDMSKIEADKLRLERIEFALDDVLERVAVLVAERAELKSLEFIVQMAADVPHDVVGDPLRLQQVLTNLATNAVKFTDRGEIRLDVDVLDADASGTVLRFSISDTGIGIAPEALARLFEPFVQADPSTTRRFGGTGLGLSISKRLVGMMGGDIWVESEVGQGSRFRFTTTVGHAAAGERVGGVTAPSCVGLRALVVDPSPSARAVLTSLLSPLGMRVDEVGDAAAALAAVTAADASDPFRLVLLASAMPGASGIEVARRLKREANLRRPPFTGVVATRSAASAATPGVGIVDGFLSKPVIRASLLDFVGGLLGAPLRRQHRSSSGHGARTASLAGVKVLLVEDNDINQVVASEILLQAGAKVDVAENGAVALEKLRPPGARERYDVVLMDLQMPVMDGYEATRRIRAIPELDDLPIVAMTAHAMREERTRCLEAGMNDHLTKPIDRWLVCSTVAEWARLATVSRASESAPTSSEGFPEIEGIDAADGLGRLGGNATLYRQLLERFAAREVNTSATVVERLLADDREFARSLAHALKGGAGNLGARGVAELAARVEQRLRAGAAAADVLEDARALEVEVARVAEAIGEALAEPGAGSALRRLSSTVAPSLADAPELVAQAVAPLLELVSRCDGEALGAFALAETQLTTWLGPEVEAVGDALQIYDFDGALETLRRLCAARGLLV